MSDESGEPKVSRLRLTPEEHERTRQAQITNLMNQIESRAQVLGTIPTRVQAVEMTMLGAEEPDLEKMLLEAQQVNLISDQNINISYWVAIVKKLQAARKKRAEEQTGR